MVEFGLKLEDNTVEEWKSHYIDYEGLKKLIKNANKAHEHRLELERRNPSLAADIKENYQKRINSSALNQIVEDEDDGCDKESFVTQSGTASPDEVSQNENVPLLSGFDMSHIVSKYGSNDSKNFHKSESSSSLGNFIKGVKKGLSFSYDSKMLSALEAETLAMEKFSTAIYKEVAKVNNFYRDVGDEIENMLNFLTEQAGPSYNFKKKKKQLLEDMRRTLQKKMHAFSKNGGKLTEDHNGDYDLDNFELGGLSASERSQTNDKVKEADSIRRALTDLHRRAKLLMNYAMINSTGFIKIIKKFTKHFPEKKDEYAEVLEESFICGGGKRVRGLCSRMEHYYANWFCDGNETEARSLMLPKKGDGLNMDWSQLRLGYRLGMCSILMVWVAWDCIWGYVKDGHSTIGGRTAFPVFRACGGLLLLHWFWGFSVYIWNRHRINYIFLFDFDPRIVYTPIMIFEDATDETLVFLILMLLYYKSGAEAIPDVIPSGGYPFLLVLYTIKCLVFPWKIRKPMWKAIFAVISAPLTAPTFFHTYIADVFTSMVKVFQDIWWTGCFIISRDFLISENSSSDMLLTYKWATSFWYSNVVIPLICLFPLWIRFNQCLRRYMDTRKRFPNLANALKYALSQTVTLFGAFHPLYLMHKDRKFQNDDFRLEEDNSGPSHIFDMFWFFLFVSSSLYSYFWDVYMDWGLGRRKHGFLGSRLMFPNKSYYYYVMVADLFLRFMWVTTLIPPRSGAAFEIPNYLTLVTMAMELLRRTFWGFFRMEHEHRHNTSGFRRVDFVPLHFSTGHEHRYKRKEHIGWSVLGEVTVITAFVVTVSIASVIAAQKATNGIAAATEDHTNKDL